MGVSHSWLVFVLLIGFTPGITPAVHFPYLRCAPTVLKAFGECVIKLENRLDLGDDNSVPLNATSINCCYFAEFLHCLDAVANDECSKQYGASIKKASKGSIKFSSLNEKCGNYSYNSSLCFIVYYSKESPPCVTSVHDAFKECYLKLQDNLDFDEEDFRMNSTIFNCCYFAEFQQCQYVKADGECSNRIEKFIDLLNENFVVKDLHRECGNHYSHLSQSCLMVYRLKESPRCVTSALNAFKKCYPKLQNQLDFDEEDFRGNSTLFNCCYFANFSYCLHEESDKNCSSKVDTFLGVYEPTRSLYGECTGYSHEDPPCFMVYHTITSLIIGGVLLSLIVTMLIRYILVPLFIYCCAFWVSKKLSFRF